jgi:hypothetical protein
VDRAEAAFAEAGAELVMCGLAAFALAVRCTDAFRRNSSHP